MSERKFYVYEHWRTDRQECFYVGKGQGSRAWDLRHDRNKWHSAIVGKLERDGLTVDVKVIFSCDLEEDAFRKERERIAHWRSNGIRLVNLTDGGEGQSGYKHTDETRERLRVAMTGRVMTPEWRHKIGAAQKGKIGWSRGKKLSPEHVAAAAAGHTGSKRSFESRAKMSAAKTHEMRVALGNKHRGVKKSASQIEKMRLANMGKTHGPEAKRKVSEHNQKLWADPAYREKQRLARLESWARRKSMSSETNTQTALVFGV